jgi:DNA-binding MarR family transcriptional regulator
MLRHPPGEPVGDVCDVSTTAGYPAPVATATDPWLDEGQQRAWRRFVAVQAQLARHLNRQLQACGDLSLADYEVLVHLSEAPGEQLRAFELGAALQWEKSRLSHHLTRMERRGLVARQECATDARGADVTLTRAGRAAVVAAAPGHVAEIRRVFVDALTPGQLDDLAAACDAVLDRLGE